MRVALVTLHTSPLEQPGSGDAGGMNVVVLELARALASFGHAVTLISLRHPTEPALALHDAGIATLELAGDGAAQPRNTELHSHVSWMAEQLASHLNEFDVIHSHYWLSAAAVAEALRIARADGVSTPRHVMSLHTIGAEKRALTHAIETDVRTQVERALVQSTPIIAASVSEADALRKHYGANDSTVTVIPPGVDTDTFSPAPQDEATGAITVAVVGRIQPYKGQDFALEVFARTIAELNRSKPPIDAQLVIAGEHTPDESEYLMGLHAQAEALGLSSHTLFVGALSRTETAALLRSATVTIVPSLSETFGLVALESAACATPVLAGRVGGLCESVRGGMSGVLMPNRDPQEWTSALVALIADEALRTRLRAGALQFAREHSWLTTAKRYESVYAELKNAQR